MGGHGGHGETEDIFRVYKQAQGVRVYIEDKYSALPAGSSMAEFSQKQLEQLKEIFVTPLNKLSQRVGELSQQIGAVNEWQIRQEGCLCADMQNHHAPHTPNLVLSLHRKEVAQLHGETFARGRIIMSLEDLARFVQDCDLGRRASAEELTDTTQKLANVLLTRKAPDRFIRCACVCACAHGKCTDLQPTLQSHRPPIHVSFVQAAVHLHLDCGHEHTRCRPGRAA